MITFTLHALVKNDEHLSLRRLRFLDIKTPCFIIIIQETLTKNNAYGSNVIGKLRNVGVFISTK